MPKLVVNFDGIRQEIDVTYDETITLANGQAVAYVADHMEPFVTDDGQLGERVLRPEVQP